MTRTVALFLAMLMTAVALAGCTGDDTELNAANDRIAELGSQAEVDQARIAELGSQAEVDQARIAELGSQAEVDQARIAELGSQADVLQDDVDAAYDNGYADGWNDGNFPSTLDTIIDRGSMKCGVKDNQYGMGYYDWDTGVWSGLDIEYCKAIAAAIGLDPETDVEYILASGSDRFNMLADGLIDVLIRTSTWTTNRDAGLDADFGAINFYDGQGILVNRDAFPDATSALDLDGASICVAVGSTSAGNIEDFFEENGMEYQAVSSWDDGGDFADELCDAVTGDMSGLVSMMWQYEQDGTVAFEMAIMQEVISKEPLASVTRDYDSEWNEIVSWVWYGLITAEEMGVTSSNYASMASDACTGNSNPNMCRLLTQNLGLGTADNPLSDTWMQDVLDAVGNYGEAYDSSFCDGSYDGVSGSDGMTGCLISRSGTYNALVREGGLQYAPPMR